MQDLELMTVGLVIDMHTESMNDAVYADKDYEVEIEASQADFDSF